MKLLFLGDSITDAYHCFDPDNLGEGYVRMIHAKLQSCLKNTSLSNDLTSHNLSITNKGIDGFTVFRVYDMWRSLPNKDCWDIVSILVGVNDVGMWMDREHLDTWIQSSVSDFARTYEDLVTDILDHDISNVILMEPFIFPCPEKYSIWQPWMRKISSHIQNIAKRYHLTFLPLQKILSESVSKEDYPSITTDGIHLTEKGNRILADTWLHYLHSS